MTKPYKEPIKREFWIQLGTPDLICNTEKELKEHVGVLRALIPVYHVISADWVDARESEFKNLIAKCNETNASDYDKYQAEINKLKEAIKTQAHNLTHFTNEQIKLENELAESNKQVQELLNTLQHIESDLANPFGEHAGYVVGRGTVDLLRQVLSKHKLKGNE